METNQVVLIDDHAILREGLKLIIERMNGFEVIGEASNGQDGLKLIKEKNPNVVILDISMPLISGIDVCREIGRLNNPPKIVILSRHNGIEFLADLLKYKIAAYLIKEDATDCLEDALNAAINNHHYYSKQVSSLLSKINNSNKKGPKKGILTIREREILKLVAEGKTSDAIANVLFISPKTVQVHRKNLLKKLGVDHITDLVKIALKMKLID